MKTMTLRGKIVRAVILLAAAFLLFWFMLPPLNPRSPLFWQYILLLTALGVVLFGLQSLLQLLPAGVVNVVRSGEGNVVRFPNAQTKSGKPGRGIKVLLIAIGVLVALMILVSLVGSQLFNAKRYSQLITFTDGDFATDVAELSMTQIPVVDRDTSIALGKRKLGEMSDLVSQFNIADNYTQINYNGMPVRVSPLVYGDIIKWMRNSGDGIPGYIMVNMTTQEASLVRLQEGIRYSESEYFMRNIHRYLRFCYPTRIFDSVSFEIDDSGTPYWVASTVAYRIAWWSGYDIGGAVLVNAITGESAYYDLADIPSWVDQIFDAELIMQQLEYTGKYGNGFFNSIFGQSGVLQPTQGYNYLAINDDVWLYTGMTSVLADESNVGFVLVNLRTKETKFYSIPGAEEYSARESAEGQVQHLAYRSTFPLLLNIADRPTYFMSLKDEAGLVKMYAFVDVAQYQIVGTGVSVDEARRNYIARLSDENIETPGETQELTGKVAQIVPVVLDGNTLYYLRLAGDDNVYVVSVALNDRLPFVAAGDTVSMNISVHGEEHEVTAFSVK